MLVYGAGVIGCYLAHVLCAAGNEVTLLTRGAWKDALEKDGLVIRHRLQRKTTVDRPAVIGTPDSGAQYNVVFAVMQHQQLWMVLDELAALDAPLVVLVGNNVSAPEMEWHILEKTKTPKIVLFGFQGTAGQREGGVVHCVRFGGGSMSIGGLHSEADKTSKEKIASLFSGTKYRLTWMPDMDGWHKTHLTLILPVVYVCYAVGCDLRKATRAQRRLTLDAAGEACAMLKRLGVPVLPEGSEQYYRPGTKRRMMSALLFIMAKTAVGELAASDHARHAVTELEGLDGAFMELRAQAADFPMPAFEARRRATPAWAALHRLYDGKNTVGVFAVNRSCKERETTMDRKKSIQTAYRSLGGEATFYDGMITCSTLPGRLVCGLVWNMGREKNARYLEKALAPIPEGFSGSLQEVPVGTGVLTMPVYQMLPRAEITCLDYSADMMVRAERRAAGMGLRHVRFR